MKDWGVNDRQVAYWESIGLPHSVAKLQAEWERRTAIVRLRHQGMTYEAIAKALRLSRGRIGQIVDKHTRKHETPPVMAHLTRHGELYDLTKSKHTMKMIGLLARRQGVQRDWMEV